MGAEPNCRLRKALKAAPDNAGAYIIASVVYQGKNQLDKATAALTSAPEAVVLDSQALYFAIIETLITANKPDEAKKYLEAYKKSYPESGHIAEYFESREMLVGGRRVGRGHALGDAGAAASGLWIRAILVGRCIHAFGAAR